MNSIKKYFTALTLLVFLFAAINLPAQDKKDDSWKSKIKQVKGKIQKIVISTKNGNTTFEGGEAERLFEHLKMNSSNFFKIAVENDDDSEEGNTFIVKIDSDASDKSNSGKNLVWVTQSIDDNLGAKVEKKINVNIENGKKIVTVTTTKDGKESVKTYKGKEADKFLEKHNGKNFDILIMQKGNHGKTFLFNNRKNKNGNKIWVQADNDADNVNKNVEVEKKNGKLKVTVTTTKDGKKTVKVYEDEKAEKYLDENNDNDFEFETSESAKSITVFETCDADSNNTACTKIKNKKIKVKIIKNKKNDNDED